MTTNPKENSELGIVLVTAGSKAEAEAIAQTLVKASLAACISIFPIYSIYRWQGQVQAEDEWQLIIKTNLAQFSELAEQVNLIHSYEVPEIIALPIITGSQIYLNWLNTNCGTIPTQETTY